MKNYFPILANSATAVPHSMQNSAVDPSFHSRTLSFRRKLCAVCRKIKSNTVYRLASALLPQNKLILFSSSPEDKFGNISALAQKLQANQISFLWLNQAQFNTYPLRSLIALARARVLVIDAESPAAHVNLHRHTCLIHCWHAGGAYKKVAFDAKRKDYDDSHEEKRIKRIHRGISYFVCTSDETAQIYAKAFRLTQDQMLVFGSPRLDSFLVGAPSLSPSTYTILYAPTYRTKDKNIRYIPALPDANTLRTSLSSRLGEAVRLAFRGHPCAPVPDTFSGWENWSNIPQHKALQETSVLITDYSSIFFDFLPFKRPIIFYVPDLDSYQSHERELYFSPYDMLPETTCVDEETLIQILERCHHKEIDHEKIWQKHMSACDGKATERLCAFIQKIMQRETL